jgi:hypothetical protein
MDPAPEQPMGEPNFRQPGFLTALERANWKDLAIGAATLPIGFVLGFVTVFLSGAVLGRGVAEAPVKLLISALVALAVPLGCAVHSYATRHPWRGHGALLALALLVGASILALIALGQAMAGLSMLPSRAGTHII